MLIYIFIQMPLKCVWINKTKNILWYLTLLLFSVNVFKQMPLKCVWINKTKFVLYYMTFCSSVSIFLYKCFLNVYGKWENKAKLILFYKWYFLVQCQCFYTNLLKYVWINKTKFVLYYMIFCSSSYCICHGEIISI